MANPKKLSSISVNGSSCQTTYYAGQYFNTSGVVVTAHYTNGTSSAVTTYLWGPQTALTTSDAAITFTYSEGGITKSAQLPITVYPATAPVSLSVSGTPVLHYAGDTVDLYGLTITAQRYNGASFHPSAGDCVVKVNGVANAALSAGPNAVALSYSESGVTVSAAFQMDVSALPASSPAPGPFEWRGADLALCLSVPLFDFNPEGYPLRASLEYQSVQTAAQRALSPELPGNWGLSVRSKVALDGGVPKLFDATGRVLAFGVASGDYSCSTGGGTEVLRVLQGGGYEIEDEDGAKASFDAAGRIVSANRFGAGGLTLCVSYRAGQDLVDEIFYSHAQTTKAKFVYDAQDRLTRVDYYLEGAVAESVSLAYAAGGALSAVRDGSGQTAQDRTLITYDGAGFPSRVRDARSGRETRYALASSRLDGATRAERRLVSAEDVAAPGNQETLLSDRTREGVVSASGRVREVRVTSRGYGSDDQSSFQAERTDLFVLRADGSPSHSFPTSNGEPYPEGEDLGVRVPSVSGAAALSEYFGGAAVLRCPGSACALTVTVTDPQEGAVSVFRPFRQGGVRSVTFRLTCCVRVDAERGRLALSLTVNGRVSTTFLDPRVRGSFQPVAVGFRILGQEGDTPSMSVSLSDGAGSPVPFDVGDMRVYPGAEETAELGGVPLGAIASAALPGGDVPVWLTPLDVARSKRELASSPQRNRVLYACGGALKAFYPAAFAPSFSAPGSSPVPLSSSLVVGSESADVDVSGLSPRELTFSASAEIGFPSGLPQVSSQAVHSSVKAGQTLTQTWLRARDYDRYGRLLLEEVTVDSNSFRTAYEYGDGVNETSAVRASSDGDLVLRERSFDSLGRPTVITDGDRSEKRAYGGNGRTSRIVPRTVNSSGSFSDSTPPTVLAYDGLGRLTGVAFGEPASNPLEHAVAYDARGETESVRVAGGPGWLRQWAEYPGLSEGYPLPAGTQAQWERRDYRSVPYGYVRHRGSGDFLGVFRDGRGRAEEVFYDYDGAESVSLAYRNALSGELLSASAYAGWGTQNEFDAGGGISASASLFESAPAFVETFPRGQAPVFFLYDAPADVSDYEPAEIRSPASGADSLCAACSVCGDDLPTLTTFYEHDAYGRLSAMRRSVWSYGSGARWGEEISYRVRGQRLSALPSQVKVYLGGNQPAYTCTCLYNSRSRMTGIGMMGSSLSFTYDSQGRISGCSASRADTPLYGCTYAYDANGNLQYDGPSGNRSQFSYDAGSGRLASVSAGGQGAPTQVALSYTYYGSGQRETRVSGTGAGATTTTYSYFGNRLSSVEAGGGYVNYLRDERGRIRERVSSGMGRSAVWHWSGDRLVAIVSPYEAGCNEVLAFFYDARGASGFVRYLCYDSFGIANRTGFVTCHFVRDALGDVLGVAVANQDGTSTTVATYLYDPWGLPLESDEDPAFPFLALNPFRYRGYLYDRHAGLYLLGERAYDPQSRCFLQPDDPEYLEPVLMCGVLRYAYCYNNPITYTDNTGHMPILVAALIGLAVGAVLAGGFETGKQLVMNNFDWSNLDWAAIGRQAVIGGALGFAGGAGGAALGGLLVGGASITGAQALAWFGLSSAVSFAGGVGAYAVETFGHGSEWDWGEAVGSGFMGMAAGMIAYGAGGVSKLVLGSGKWMTQFILRQGVKFVFSWPMNFAESQLVNYLS